MGQVISLAQKIICFPVRLYQYLISPALKPGCRFYPSCSHYFIEAVETFGIFKGGVRGLMRLLRCHPFSAGGYDPVIPEKKSVIICGKKDKTKIADCGRAKSINIQKLFSPNINEKEKY